MSEKHIHPHNKTYHLNYRQLYPLLNMLFWHGHSTASSAIILGNDLGEGVKSLTWMFLIKLHLSETKNNVNYVDHGKLINLSVWFGFGKLYLLPWDIRLTFRNLSDKRPQTTSNSFEASCSWKPAVLLCKLQ